MFEIVRKEQYSQNVFRLDVEAPLIAKSRKAGNFVIVRAGEKGERIPLTIADSYDGKIVLVVQQVGVSTRKICALNVGDSLTDVVGPLGHPTAIANYGTVLCAGGGVGVAPMLPIIRALKACGNRVISVLAGRTKELIIMEKEVREASDEVIIMTDDGSYGQKGVVTVGMEQVIQREKVDKCFAIGPGVMMKFCCVLTKKYNIPTDVSLNTIMVDGTGMCGACRVTVGGRMKFVCVDGPEFDGHEVDWDEMLTRLRQDTNKIPTEETATKDNRLGEPNMPNTPIMPAASEARPLTMKERMAIPRVQMPELDPAYRARKLKEEVNLGLTPQQAQREALRCIQCKKPGCVEGCPVSINIPAFIHEIAEGRPAEANRIIRQYSSLPAVCGRVCPQEKQCEARCIHLKMKSEPVAIGYLERFAAQAGTTAAALNPANQTNSPDTSNSPKSPKSDAAPRIAVVGSGPAGLSFAGEMTGHGFRVTVFEALHELGGVLRYGIPEYRLPNTVVDAEIQTLKNEGVEFVTDCIIGKTISVEQLLKDGFKGIFVASGAGLPRFMNIPGENLKNILSSNEYLTRVNLMDASNPASDTPVVMGKKVMVVGGGNTAMDSVRTALRLGAEEATIVYRRSEDEMPARKEEVKHAKEEGVRFLTLHNPLEYHADEQGNVKEVVLQKMRLGEPDESGRRSPVPIEGETETLAVDEVIVAVGVSPNPIVPRSVEGLELGRKNTIAVNEQMQSSIPVIYAGGDIVRGGATVILAMGDGKRAAKAMAEQLLSPTA